MTTPIVLSLGELLWDMLPSGKRAGGAPVNFAYHAMKNGTEGWAISTPPSPSCSSTPSRAR